MVFLFTSSEKECLFCDRSEHLSQELRSLVVGDLAYRWTVYDFILRLEYSTVEWQIRRRCTNCSSRIVIVQLIRLVGCISG